jgi:hypothetical protein
MCYLVQMALTNQECYCTQFVLSNVSPFRHVPEEESINATKIVKDRRKAHLPVLGIAENTYLLYLILDVEGVCMCVCLGYTNGSACLCV